MSQANGSRAAGRSVVEVGSVTQNGTRRQRLTRRHLVIWASAMAVLGWVMMTIGAVVRATESGLGCPDWPACHGKLVAGGHHALVEEVHRWVATVLVIGVVGLAVVVLRRYRRERAVLVPTLCTLALLALQVVLGGITVLLKNVAWTVVAHYGGAALLVAAIALLAVRLAHPMPGPAARDRFATLVAWFSVLTYGLLLAGSTLANAGSDTACGSGYPLCNGSLFPALDHNVAIELIHRVWAGAMLLFAIWYPPALVPARELPRSCEPRAWSYCCSWCRLRPER